MQILAIIPARKGSKSIKFKNIKLLAGKPLIEYTINSAKKSCYVNRIVVSTDSTKIMKLSQKLGVDVPFKRPKKFSLDNSTNIDVVKHTLTYLKNKESYIPNIVLLLQPTSPLRTTKLIDNSIKLLIKSKADSVVSVSEMKEHPLISFSLQRNFLKPNNPNFQKFGRRQSRPTYYIPNGAIFTFWLNTIKKFNSIYGKRIKPLLIKNPELVSDIDNVFDFFTSEMTILHWKKFQNKFKN